MENEKKKEQYIITQEEYNAKIQPSWNKKTPIILEAAVWMNKLTPETNYSIGLRIEEHARDYPNNLALLYEDEKYTYKQLNEQINRYANYFNKLGFKKGDTAVIFVENRSEYMFIIIAMAKLGVVSSLILIAFEIAVVVKESFMR